MIIGYPTETEEDHQITLNTIQKLFDDGYIGSKAKNDALNLSFGNTFMLTDTMKLWEKIKDDAIYRDNIFDWDYKDNTLFTRVRRFKEIHELIQKLNNGVSGGLQYKKSLRMYEKLLEEKNKKNGNIS
jgi:hypothetical protein